MAHTCKNCLNQFTGKFCNECGEKVYSIDRSFKHLFAEVFHFFTHFEGTFFNTVKAMAVSPGRISADFTAGIRKRYFKPVPFFLFVVILYLLFPIYEGLNMRLRFHQHGWYGQYATEQITKVREKKNYTFEELEEAFHDKGEKTSKFLLVIIIPIAAMVSYLLAFKRRSFFFDHFIFSTEASSFLILWGFLILPIFSIITVVAGFNFLNSDGPIGIFMLLGVLIYLYFAARRFFKMNFWLSALYALFFSAALWIILMHIYKFILFVITIRLA